MYSTDLDPDQWPRSFFYLDRKLFSLRGNQTLKKASDPEHKLWDKIVFFLYFSWKSQRLEYKIGLNCAILGKQGCGSR